ncbi:hypothetical protein GTO89_00550 [Heliobacterium gestii]|uniref:Uncharacterized protein n=1 Tax=Heliomicrobium gestii TaxID=2699 RepID=A0A845L9B9_HELGE|nr:hypothetical protein [Heliomicrobium gestii]MBM7865255.1 hypothetical protein [Heliomicrobium gestii]MZP41520.1 hypothetical protein [Heliomicrobium gestii]
MERPAGLGLSQMEEYRGSADPLEPRVLAVELAGLKGRVGELEARVVSLEKQLEILARHLAHLTCDPAPVARFSRIPEQY